MNISRIFSGQTSDAERPTEQPSRSVHLVDIGSHIAKIARENNKKEAQDNSAPKQNNGDD